MKNIYVAGHNGMVGSAIIKQLQKQGDVNIITRSRSELDLLDQKAVHNFFAAESIDQVYLSAAKVGGIMANNEYPGDFIYQNLMIEAGIGRINTPSSSKSTIKNRLLAIATLLSAH